MKSKVSYLKLILKVRKSALPQPVDLLLGQHGSRKVGLFVFLTLALLIVHAHAEMHSIVRQRHLLGTVIEFRDQILHHTRLGCTGLQTSLVLQSLGCCTSILLEMNRCHLGRLVQSSLGISIIPVLILSIVLLIVGRVVRDQVLGVGLECQWVSTYY